MCTTGCSKFSAVYQNEKVALTPHEKDVKFDVNYQNHYLQKNTCIFSSNSVLLKFSAVYQNEKVAQFDTKNRPKWHQSMVLYSYGRDQNISWPLLVSLKTYDGLKVSKITILLQ